MDTNRLVNIVLTELSLENLKLQEELEKVINSGLEINNKSLKIRELLEKIVLNELKVTKFQSMVQPQKDNDNNEAKTN